MKDKLLAFPKWIWNQIKAKKWYTFLLVLSTSYLVYYRFDIYDLETINARNLIFLLWLLLLAFPLFSELEFLGIKVKKEVEKATEEVKESLQNIQAQITQVQMTNKISPSFNFGSDPLATEKKMDALLRAVEDLQQSRTNEIPETKYHSKNEDKSVFLFKIRLEIETTLRELCEKTGYIERTSITQMVRYLNRTEVLSGTTCELIHEVNKIANRGVHGEIVSDEYIKFVEEAYPKIMSQLKNAVNRLTLETCPRCHYSGPALYDNVCPNCGYVDDD